MTAICDFLPKYEKRAETPGAYKTLANARRYDKIIWKIHINFAQLSNEERIQ